MKTDTYIPSIIADFIFQTYPASFRERIDRSFTDTSQNEKQDYILKMHNLPIYGSTYATLLLPSINIDTRRRIGETNYLNGVYISESLNFLPNADLDTIIKDLADYEVEVDEKLKKQSKISFYENLPITCFYTAYFCAYDEYKQDLVRNYFKDYFARFSHIFESSSSQLPFFVHIPLPKVEDIERELDVKLHTPTHFRNKKLVRHLKYFIKTRRPSFNAFVEEATNYLPTN